MRNHPLYNRVQSIVIDRARHGKINRSAFDSIRNKASLMAIMLYLGYQPNDPVCPKYWKYGISNQGSKNTQSSLADENKRLDDLLMELSLQPIYYLPENEIERRQIIADIRTLRKQGVQIKSIKAQGSRVLGYGLK